MSAPSPQRWMALRFPWLATERLRQAGHAPPEPQPFALYAKTANAFRLTAPDRHAIAAGLSPGMALADARALRPDLCAIAADPAADAAALEALAAWCERLTPLVVLDPPEGLFLEVGGSAHLFGGEAALLAHVPSRLARHGFTAQAAIAATPGAAFALARHAPGACVSAEETATALGPLPIAALRLAPPSAALLNRLGMKTIGQLLSAPRAPFAARAGEAALLRLDQALGRAVEALSPRRPPPPVFALRRLLEPIVTLEAVLTVAAALCGDLARSLDMRGMGARTLRICLFGVDGRTRTVAVRLSRPERQAEAMLRLLRERLSVAAEGFDAAFGFEAARLEAVTIAPMTDHAPHLAGAESGGRDRAAEARLADLLAARLGASCVGRLQVRDAHAPERASAFVPSGAGVSGLPAAPPEDGVMRRPLTLFHPPQPIEAIATVPDGPPVRFRWRRQLHEVARAEGPERLSPNWLASSESRTRDHYRVEDRAGRRFWLYREGLYDEEGPTPRWFLGGLFA